MKLRTSLLRLGWLGLLPLLGACASLQSRQPLIASSDFEPGIAGVYQAMGAADPATRAQIPEKYRDACLDPRYSVVSAAPRQKGRRIRLFYCGFDANARKPFPRFRIVQGATSYSVTTPDGTAAFRLRRFRDGVYLAQVDDGSAERQLYNFALVRIKPPGIEVFLLGCDDFPSIARRAPPSGPFPEAAPPTICIAESLDRVDPELLAFVVRMDAGERVPVAILKRLGD